MKVVNRSNVPEMIFKGLQKDEYDYDNAGDFSATSLIKPIQITILEKRYWDKIEVDAIDRLWSVFGSAIHKIYEDIEIENSESETRLSTQIRNKIITGKFDRRVGDHLYDLKVTSAWTLRYGSRLDEWKLQLSIYRYLYWRVNEIELSDTAYILAILRDWSEKNVGINNYPDAPIVQVELKLEPISYMQHWIYKRVDDILCGESLSDDNLPECTPEEKWYNEKKGNIRCEKYCNVKEFCKQRERENE